MIVRDEDQVKPRERGGAYGRLEAEVAPQGLVADGMERACGFRSEVAGGGFGRLLFDRFFKALGELVQFSGGAFGA